MIWQLFFNELRKKERTTIRKILFIFYSDLVRETMIVGSDYTKGIPNAAIITALEILQEFHGTCMERLEKFRWIGFLLFYKIFRS